MILPIARDTVLHEGAEEAPEIIETLDKAQSEALRGKVTRMVDRARLEVVLARAAQQRINTATQRIETKVSEAVGEWVCRVNLSVFLYNRNQHGNRCWRDPEFLKWFQKQEPGAFPQLHLRRYVNGADFKSRRDQFGSQETRKVKEEAHTARVTSASPHHHHGFLASELTPSDQNKEDPSTSLRMTVLNQPEVVR